VEGTWFQYSISLAGMLCVYIYWVVVYILFKFVEILGFDDLVLFFYVKKIF